MLSFLDIVVINHKKGTTFRKYATVSDRLMPKKIFFKNQKEK